MIAKCDNCQAAFNIKENLIKPSGSKVRCFKCKHIFVVYPPEIPDVTAEIIEPEPTAPTAPPSPPKSGQEHTVTIVDFSEDVFEKLDFGQEQYEEMGSIGKGGMGEVLLAKDKRLLRKVAIKVLRDDQSSPAALSYFIREAQITAQLDHPNIVPLYNVKPPSEDEENVSFVMKFIRGTTLGDIVQRAREAYTENPKATLQPEMQLRYRLEYFLKACEGITYSHRKGVVHRDLKPANIMIGDYGEVYIMDWGIAKMLREDMEDNLTSVAQGTRIFTGDMPQSGTDTAGQQPEGVVGTLSYMSPEQATADPEVGPASDIFSLGAVLFELITLRPPRAGDPSQKLEWARGGFLNQMEHLLPERKIDPELRAIFNKATEIDPRDRYPSVSRLAADVRAYLRGDEVTEFPDNLPRKVWRWMNKHRVGSLIAVMSVLLFFATIAIFSLYKEQAALKAARLRENRLSYLQAQVSSHSHEIDNRFLRLEDLAAGLAYNAMYLIQDAPQNNERFYWISEFKDPKKAPPDHDYSSMYQRNVSIDYPVVKRAPGVTKESVAALMQKLAPLRYHFKRTVLDSRDSLEPLTEKESRRLMTVHGVPIRWAFIGLEAGVMYSYPGKGTYSDAYDPRVRPWYELGAHKNAVYWGNPYLDVQGQGLVLPCATSLYDKNKKFYGVLGMDVTFSDIIQDNLRRPGSVGVIESYLLDDKGRIVVRSSQMDSKVDTKVTNARLELKPFPVTDVVKAIGKGESGLTEIKKERFKTIIVFYRLRSLGCRGSQHGGYLEIN